MSLFSRLRLPVVVAIAHFALMLPLTTQLFAQTPNLAAGLGWRGYVVTGIQAAEFVQGDFTVAARFLSQYPLAYAGAILATENTGFLIAKQDDKAALVVEIGGQLYEFSGGGFAERPRGWHHVALVRAGTEWSIYLDGRRLCPEHPPCAMKGGARAPAGALILGRLAPGVTFGGHEPQFYGLIDDVAVFRRSLNADEIGALAKAPRLTGAEKDLFAGITFDAPLAGHEPPAALKRTVNFVTVTKGHVEPHAPARAVGVSDNRNGPADAGSLDGLLPPVQQAPLQLPIPLGETWMVVQGWQGKISHHGRAAFALDLSVAATGPSPQNTRATLNRPVYAAAPGKVTQIRNDRGSCEGWPANYVMVDHAPEEVGAYLHFAKSSVAVKAGDTIANGAYLARAADTGNIICNIFHLHFSLHNKPESEAGSLVTIPAAFSNYIASSDQGRNWHKVNRGVLLEGQWLKRCPAAGERLPAGQVAPAPC